MSQCPTRNPASEPQLAVLYLRANNQTHRPWHLTRRKPPDIHRPKQVSSFPAIFHPNTSLEESVAFSTGELVGMLMLVSDSVGMSVESGMWIVSPLMI